MGRIVSVSLLLLLFVSLVFLLNNEQTKFPVSDSPSSHLLQNINLKLSVKVSSLFII